MKRLHKILHQVLILILSVCLSSVIEAQNMSAISISNVSTINSAALEFSPAFYKDGIVFVSNKAIEGRNKIYDKKINTNTMSIFISRQNGEGKLQSPEPFSFNLVSSLHEGPLSFDKNNETVFFCRNNNKSDEKARYVKGVAYMKIYSSHKKTDGTWSVAEELPFNQDESDACHPSLSADGSRLYFSSNRPEGYGGMDLYVCEKVNGKWGIPVNLGPRINSPKNEVFPFIHDENILFFSSDNEKSNGGLDIFYTIPDKKGGFEMPSNIGKPFNSELDDFGFILDKDRKLGYLTSDRLGGAGADDIYTFSVPNGWTANFEEAKTTPLNIVEEDIKKPINIHVLDRKTGKSLENVAICPSSTGADAPSAQTISSNCESILTDKFGKSALKIQRSDNYFIKLDKAGYSPEEAILMKDDERDEIIILMNNLDDLAKPIASSTPNKTDKEDKKTAYIEGGIRDTHAKKDNDVALPKKTKDATLPIVDSDKSSKKPKKTTPIENQSKINTITPTADASKVKPEEKEKQTFVLRNIYYDFDKSNIRPDASKTLDSLVVILKQNPKMTIELASHTDSRGKDRYNDNLSNHRTSSAVEYLVEKGVPKSRLKTSFYGEKILTNECKDAFPCPEDKHQMNRRTEIRVLKNEDN